MTDLGDDSMLDVEVQDSPAGETYLWTLVRMVQRPETDDCVLLLLT